MPVPPVWPAGLPQMPRRSAWVGGPQDSRAAFAPEVGPDLLRRRTTAETMVMDAVFPNLSTAERAVFEAFHATTLAGGVLAFAWRDPVTDAIGLWQIGRAERPYSLTAKGAGLHDLSLKLIRKPGTPWWASYARAGSARAPDVVADWNAGVYGIAAAKVAASALPAVTGTFDVWSVSTLDVETFSAGVVITAGGIPATAPVGVKRRVYFSA